MFIVQCSARCSANVAKHSFAFSRVQLSVPWQTLCLFPYKHLFAIFCIIGLAIEQCPVFNLSLRTVAMHQLRKILFVSAKKLSSMIYHIVCNVHCTMCIVRFGVQCLMHCEVCCVQCSVQQSSVDDAAASALQVLFTVQCSVFTVHCSVEQ